MIQVLHTADEVKRAIRRVFSDPRRRRVAIVAFVGNGAADYLPKPKGTELYCWPRAGGTTAKAIRGLLKRGVKVAFADRVHMKVYWSAGNHAIVTSANLSDSALGVGGLQEAGVVVPASLVDIDRLIKRLKSTPAAPSALAKLEKAEKKRSRRGIPGRRPSDLPTFIEWLHSTPRRSWKWGYFNDYAQHNVSRRAREAAKNQQLDRVEEVVFCRRSRYQEEDWILFVRVTAKGILTTPSWVYVNGVVLVERDDRVYNEDAPFQAFQAVPLRRCPSPPFQIDASFKRAVRAASKAYGTSRTEKQVDGERPSKVFLELLRKHYR